MKDIASEAIFKLVQSEDRDKETEAYRKRLNEMSIKLQRRLPFYLFISAAVGTVIGVALGMML
jgi:type VI protein secretion system component VasK